MLVGAGPLYSWCSLASFPLRLGWPHNGLNMPCRSLFVCAFVGWLVGWLVCLFVCFHGSSFCAQEPCQVLTSSEAGILLLGECHQHHNVSYPLLGKKAEDLRCLTCISTVSTGLAAAHVVYRRDSGSSPLLILWNQIE